MKSLRRFRRPGCGEPGDRAEIHRGRSRLSGQRWFNGKRPVAREEPTGHRTVPHTADLRIEAWAPTAEQCIAEAVRAVVYSFTDPTSTVRTMRREFVVQAGDVEEQLVAVLDEVIYRMDSDDEIPRAMEVCREASALRVALAMADVSQVTIIGAVPKAVSLHQLSFGRDDAGWHCAVTLDV